MVLGQARDLLQNNFADPLGFTLGGLKMRCVTGRNSPSVSNAVYNIRNFWDGRANRRFNGRNPFGDSDPNARVLQTNDLRELESVHISIDRASLASQAVDAARWLGASGRPVHPDGSELLAVLGAGDRRARSDPRLG